MNSIKTILSIVMLVLLITPAWSQVDSEFGYIDSSIVERAKKYNGRKFIVKVNPLALVSGDIPFYSGEWRLVGEWVTGPKTSVVAGVSYLGLGILIRLAYESDTSFTNQGLNSWDIGFNGYRIQGGFRYYLKNPNLSISDANFNPAPKGAYIFPLYSYSTARHYEKANRDQYWRFTHWSLTMNFGVQLLLGEKMTLDPYVGIGYKKNTILDENKNVPIDIEEFPQTQFIYGSNFKVNLGLNLGFRL